MAEARAAEVLVYPLVVHKDFLQRLQAQRLVEEHKDSSVERAPLAASHSISVTESQ